MRKLISLFLFLALSSLVFAQTQVIQDFEDPNDSTYWGIVAGDNSTDATKADMTFQNTNSVSGSAVSVDWLAEDSESWGGFVKFEHYAPDSMLYDWSKFDTVSFWYFNESPQSTVGDVHIRFNLYEASEVPDTTSNSNDMEFYYSFHYNILDDSSSQWQKISIPLMADGNYWNGEGFNRTGWSGVAGNDHFDADKIKGYCFEFSIGGGGDGSNSSGIIIFDQLELSGLAQDPWLIFNGKTLDNSFEYFQWGSSLEIVEGAGEDPATNALKWTQSDGWSGAGWNVVPPHDFGYRWSLDSLKFKLKTNDAFELSRLQFESGGDGAVGYAFTPISDGLWNDYAIPLRDFYVVDGKSNFDTTNVTVFQMMAEGNGHAGFEALYDFIWTGNPEIDVVPPVAPTGVTAIQGTYQNLVTWIDVPNEEDGVYNVLYSTSPITSLEDEGLEVVAKNISPGTQIATHIITAPMVDTDLTYYYAVYCVDAAGNDGELAGTDAVTNTAKGVTTIHPEAPANFIADGNLSEWASIPEFRVFPSDGSGTIVNNMVIDGDADLSVNAWVAIDDDYIYFAYDVEDDVVDIDTTKSSWMRDCPELYLGLYDWHGESHTGLKKGLEPDVHFRFNSNQIIVDNWGGKVLARPSSDNYHWASKFPTGYVVEGKISLDSLASEDGVESRFHPLVGMRIPMDIEINDNDEPSNSDRQGQLTYSKINQGLSYSNVSLWTHTWIGDEMVGVDDKDLSVNTYGLSQNYPNPFNPSTVINYSLANSGMVSLKIYNILGQEVLTLVNTNQNVGQYQVKFDASHLSSGLYIYRIQSGNFVDSKKMMLLK